MRDKLYVYSKQLLHLKHKKKNIEKTVNNIFRERKINFTVVQDPQYGEYLTLLNNNRKMYITKRNHGYFFLDLSFLRTMSCTGMTSGSSA